MDMSSPRFGDTIEFEPGASARAVIALFWVHAVPLALVLATPLQGPVMAGLALLVGGSWLWLRRHPVFGFGPRALVKFRWEADGGWALTSATGEQLKGRLEGNSVLLGPVLVLSFRLDGGGGRTRLLMGDETPPAIQQRLRARLSVAASDPA